MSKVGAIEAATLDLVASLADFLWKACNFTVGDVQQSSNTTLPLPSGGLVPKRTGFLALKSQAAGSEKSRTSWVERNLP